MSPAVYTINEVCELFKVRRCTVYRMIDRGELRMLKLGKSTRIPAVDVERMLAATSAPRLTDAPLAIRQKKAATQPEAPQPR